MLLSGYIHYFTGKDCVMGAWFPNQNGVNAISECGMYAGNIYGIKKRGSKVSGYKMNLG